MPKIGVYLLKESILEFQCWISHLKYISWSPSLDMTFKTEHIYAIVVWKQDAEHSQVYSQVYSRQESHRVREKLR